MKRRALMAVAGLASLVGMSGVAVASPASADLGYVLSGNGKVSYFTTTNKLRIEDYKNGDYLYVNYKFTNSVCGTIQSACEPAGPGTIRRDSPNIGTSEYILSPSGYTYIVFRLCNDDAPPDTCSDWKRTGA